MLLRGPLVSPEALAANLGAANLRVVDVRWVLGEPGEGRRAYEAGHLPVAIFLDLDADMRGPDGPGRHPLPRPADFARLLASRGIGDATAVVAYDDVGGGVAARLWWMLDDLGHRHAAVLDGGYPAWVAAGLPTTTGEPHLPDEPASLALAAAWTKVTDRDDLRSRLGRVVLLDARAGPRYRGETDPIDPVAGHIPTALLAPTESNLGPDGRFLGAAALRARFSDLGVADRRMEVVTSCGSGVSACHNALALRLAGLPDPTLYEGSYSDWSRAGYPIAVGPAPGEPPDDPAG